MPPEGPSLGSALLGFGHWAASWASYLAGQSWHKSPAWQRQAGFPKLQASGDLGFAPAGVPWGGRESRTWRWGPCDYVLEQHSDTCPRLWGKGQGSLSSPCGWWEESLGEAGCLAQDGTWLGKLVGEAWGQWLLWPL